MVDSGKRIVYTDSIKPIVEGHTMYAVIYKVGRQTYTKTGFVSISAATICLHEATSAYQWTFKKLVNGVWKEVTNRGYINGKYFEVIAD
jgi:hypothetical protein